MHGVRADDLTRLAADRGPARLSLFLPTHDPDTWRANQDRVRCLLQRAADVLTARDIEPRHVRHLIHGARDLLCESWLWDRGYGVALFARPDRTWCWSLPTPVPEIATVGCRFTISPLLPLLIAGRQFPALRTGCHSRYQRITRHGGPIVGPGTHVAEPTATRLHRRACPPVQSELSGKVAAYPTTTRSARTLLVCTEVVAAAGRGDVDTLFVSARQEPWHRRPGSGVLDLAGKPALQRLERAAHGVLRHGGRVVVRAADRMPGSGLLAATLRTPHNTLAAHD